LWRRRRLRITPIVIRIVIGIMVGIVVRVVVRIVVRIVGVVPPVRITPPTISKSPKKAVTIPMMVAPVMALAVSSRASTMCSGASTIVTRFNGLR
jgi:hypothetical protein